MEEVVVMEKIKELTENKIAKITMAIIKILVTIVIVCFVLVVYLQRFSDNNISFFNFRMFTVVSGSMEPKYNIGDVLIAKEVDPSTIKVGDAITYLGATGTFKGKVVTHDVVSIEKNENGEYMFYTKGLANLVVDPVVHQSQVYGVVVYKAPLLTALNRIVKTNVGFYLCIILPAMFIIGSEMVPALVKKEEKKRKN